MSQSNEIVINRDPETLKVSKGSEYCIEIRTRDHIEGLDTISKMLYAAGHFLDSENLRKAAISAAQKGLDNGLDELDVLYTERRR